MTEKTHDLAVKVGEYKQDGETKGRYENVGALMEGKDGPFVILKRTFNPAGVPDLSGEGRDSVIISCFEVEQKSSRGRGRDRGSK